MNEAGATTEGSRNARHSSSSAPALFLLQQVLYNLERAPSSAVRVQLRDRGNLGTVVFARLFPLLAHCEWCLVE